MNLSKRLSRVEAETELQDLLGKVDIDIEKDRWKYFVPNGAQAGFIKKLGSQEEVFIGLFIAANGVGKDCVMMNICANIIWGPQNPWFDYGFFRDWNYPKHIRIGTEANNVGETGSIDKEINEWWPKGKFHGTKAAKPYISRYTTSTGFIVDKMSFEQEKKEWESTTLGLACFSEPPTKEIFSATVGRMRKGGVILFFMTPLSHSAWVQDDLVDTHRHNTFVVTADIEDACKQHGTRGHLEHKDIENMIEHWDPEELDARAHGKFMHLSSVILGKSFKRDVHVVGNDLEPPYGSQHGVVVDPARGKPWAIGWFWVDKRGQIVFDHEYPEEDFTRLRESNLSLRDYHELLKYGSQGKNMEWEIIDRHYANTRDANNNTLKGQLNDEPYDHNFIDSYNCEEEIETGITNTKSYLKYDFTKPIDSQNFPKLLIKERCKNIIRAMERWQRDPKTMQVQRLSPYKDHFDLVRYACMAKLEIYEFKPLPKRPVGYVLGR